MPVIDITGQKFGRWTVLERVENSSGGKARWKCQCDCGKISIVTGTDLRNGHSKSCGHCQHISHGEELIATILDENNILYERQKTFTTCRFLDTNKLAFFDFYLSEYNILIEYDGEQHFSYRNNGWNTEEHYIQIQQRDNFKNQWCKENNIPLIRIPYTDYNKIKLNNNYLIALIKAKLN